MKPRSTVLCASCSRPLWSYVVLNSGHPVMYPVAPEVPRFHEGFKQCPFCEQSIYVEEGSVRRLWVKDEGTGYLGVA